ncbi:uncharacterized protein LOC136083655 [Hydra vulgaris]|uniref:Uncharacterized protein LOC136083655 n=1 Tax=Hydra vulgaris TaxID=6087 RepID=A0ABM4CC61_HYDVU
MANNIKSAFKNTGIFPFDVNSFDYKKIVQKLSESTVAPAPYLKENHSSVTLSAYSPITFIEKCIDFSILEQFKLTDKHLGWKGDLEYLQLYHFWKRALSETYKTINLPDEIQQGNKNLSTTGNLENEKGIADMEMPDCNNAAVIEPKPACFSLKIAAKIINPIESVLIWPKQPVQSSKRKVERLPSVVTSETWQLIQKTKLQEKSKIKAEKLKKKQLAVDKKSKVEEERLRKKQLAMEKKLLNEKTKKERKNMKIKKKKVAKESENEFHLNVDNNYKIRLR